MLLMENEITPRVAASSSTWLSLTWLHRKSPGLRYMLLSAVITGGREQEDPAALARRQRAEQMKVNTMFVIGKPGMNTDTVLAGWMLAP
jgi:hypothetical protein